MIRPPISELLKKVDNRYTLVIATAKRARMLTNGAQPLAVTKSNKDVTIAITEIKEGKIKYRYNRKGENSKQNENETGKNLEKTDLNEPLDEDKHEYEDASDEIQQYKIPKNNEPETADIQTESM
ncbi:MAG TPA: DNA-directed RNA polymerase subunit omega [Clostridia bacterium]